ncbi:hypothetical protein C4556_01185 [Candidatus Parcubacteria bacterium]|nr:MAG: hypothetical protein C4556_01185 [Candidatus Parcubacteria bacterium]
MLERYSRYIPEIIVIGIIISASVLFVRYGIVGNYEIFVDPEAGSGSARQLIAEDALACEWDDAPYLFVSDNVFSPLIYYSHIFPALGSLILALIVWKSRNRQLVNNIFVLLAGTFITWCLFDLILWAEKDPNAIMFFWSALIYLDLLIYLFAAYLLYVFVTGKDAPPTAKFLGLGLFIPFLILAPTSLNLTGFDYTNCDREAIEGALWHYAYLIEIFITIGVVGYAIYALRRTLERSKRIQISLLATGITLFLLAFNSGNIVGSFSEDWAIAQYGLFGMPIFLGIVMYLIVQFHAFRVRVIATSALVMSLWILLFSVLLLETMESARPIIVITLFFFALMGYLLVVSVRKEIRQRELIELQEKELEVANREQESLLHFISHEIKGYLTKSEAGFAAIAEGDYGAIPDALKTMSRSALAEVRKGVATVMEILDASNLKKGTVSYEKKTFDFKATVEGVVAELRLSAEEKQIKLEFSASDGSYTVTGDEDKLRHHAVRNLIDNSIKYTFTGGSVRVWLSRTGNTIRFTVEDNGVGITPEDMGKLFTEGGHGKDSLKMNVHSTGYGLYIVKKIVEGHDGKVWAESEGQGKGSKFIVELPAT